MNIFDSTRQMRRELGVLGQVISETTHESSRGWHFPSRNAFFCWALVLSVSLLMVSGCGRYKEELEGAKQQIEKLNSEVNKLTEETSRLTREKSRLSDDLKTLADKNSQMQRELDDLTKAKAVLSAENKEIGKKNNAAQEEIASLKSENARVAKEIEEFKKRATEAAPPPKEPAAVPTEVGPQSAKQTEELSPCDAVLAFMRASEGIVKQQKGEERAQSLEKVKQQYAPKMKGAPEKAIKAAEDWVKEGSKFWNQTGGSGALQLIELRNTVLEACGKSPKEAGF